MKKRFVSMSLVLAVLLLLAACAPGGTPAQVVPASDAPAATKDSDDEDPLASPAEKAKLVMYLNNQVGEDYVTLVEDFIIAEFEKTHPNITIELTLNNDPTGLAKQQLAAGAGPDIVMLDGPSTLQMFVRAGYLYPMDEYAQKFGWDERYLDWAIDTCRNNGKLYGVPDTVEGLMAFYNKELFAANGWTPPKTYDEMISLSEQMKAKGLIPFGFGCSDFKQANEWWVSYAYNAALGKVEFEKYLTGEKAWNSPELTDATVKLADMWKKEYINKNSALITIEDAHTLFATGKAAMIMEGTWFVSQFISMDVQIDWGSFVLPSWDGKPDGIVPMALGAAAGINVNCKSPDAAAEFINWMYGPEVGKEMLKLGTFYPIKGLNLDESDGLDPHVVEAYNTLDVALSSGNNGYCAWTYFPPFTETYLWDNIESLYYEKVGIDEFMTKLQEQFEKDVANDSLFKF